MDRILGSIIDDYTLYTIIESVIIILVLIAVYLGIQTILIFKFPKKSGGDPIAHKNGLVRCSIFILVAGSFMIIHEFTEGLEKDAIDNTTYELLELIAFLGLVMFLYEWRRILKSQRMEE